MSEHEEKTEALQEAVQEDAKVIEEKIEEIAIDAAAKAEIQRVKELEEKCQGLEAMATKLKTEIPNITQIGRPIHLNLINKGVLYQLIIPEGGLNNINQFAEVHSIISKFGAVISLMETNANESIAKAQADAEAKAE